MKYINNRIKWQTIIDIILFLWAFYSSLNISVWSNNLVETNQQTKIKRHEIIAQNNKALELVKQGQIFYERGNFAEAAEKWQEAADIYTQEGNEIGKIESLTNKSQALQNLGLNWQACDTSLDALNNFGIDELKCREIADEISNLKQQLETKIDILKSQPQSLSINQAIALRCLGNNFRKIGYLEGSKKVLELSLKIAKTWQNNDEISAVQIDLGNTLQTLSNTERELAQESPAELALNIGFKHSNLESNESPVKEALSKYNYELVLNHYENAAAISNDKNTKITAQINRLSLLLDLKQWWQRAMEEAANYERAKKDPKILSYGFELDNILNQKIQESWSEISAQISSLPLNWTTLYAQINLADTLLKQTTKDPTWLKDLELLLKKTTDDARELGDKRIEAMAIGYQGKLFQQQALNSQYPNKRKQNLAEAQQQTEKALQVLNQVTDKDNRDIRYRLRSQLGRIYQEQDNTKAAIGAYEAALQDIKELRNDLVSINKNLQFDFRDQVEPVYRHTVDLLIKSADSFRKKKDYEKEQERLKKARDVIEQLQLAELENFFREACIEINKESIDEIIKKFDKDTAIIYPIILDDRLEVIVSLANGDISHYKTLNSETEIDVKVEIEIEKEVTKLEHRVKDVSKLESLRAYQDLSEKIYNWLIKPWESELDDNVETLIFVLDGVLQKIPINALYDGKKYLVEKYNIGESLGLTISNSEPLKNRGFYTLAVGLSKAVEKFPAIPEVEKEIEDIEQIVSTSSLLNESFTKSNFKEQLKSNNFQIVHIATHGVFDSSYEKTFILAFDDVINARELDEILTVNNLQKQPIELLVLSACETAEGDKRSALGLAGVAVKSGANSTLASLWRIYDKSTAILMKNFYENLVNPDTPLSKIKALRQAQLKMLKDEKLEEEGYAHPYHWGAFVLVGNWR